MRNKWFIWILIPWLLPSDGWTGGFFMRQHRWSGQCGKAMMTVSVTCGASISVNDGKGRTVGFDQDGYEMQETLPLAHAFINCSSDIAQEAAKAPRSIEIECPHNGQYMVTIRMLNAPSLLCANDSYELSIDLQSSEGISAKGLKFKGSMARNRGFTADVYRVQVDPSQLLLRPASM